MEFPIEEVMYRQHSTEFERVFYRHAKICGEICGLREIQIVEEKEQLNFRIRKGNFIVAYKRISAYFIDLIHYIVEKSLIDEIFFNIEKSEKEFLSDKTYFDLLEKEKTNSLSFDSYRELMKRHLGYVINALKIVDQINDSLKSTILISPKFVYKQIGFREDKYFYDQLAVNRNFVANAIADFRLKKVFQIFKKIMAYYYTYKYILPTDFTDRINKLISLFKDYVLSADVFKILYTYLHDSNLTAEVYKESKVMTKALLYIYRAVNSGLSYRGILPKTKMKIFIDRTLI